jgi:OmcA/MtrC family decaheme c-type cytochrome
MERGVRANRSCLVVLLLWAAVAGFACSNGSDGAKGAQGSEGPPGPEGPPGDPGTIDPDVALEACVGCHGQGEVVPVGNIHDVLDAHFVDTHPDGPLTRSGYRQLKVELTSVDVSRTVDPNSLIINFEVTNENDDPVTNLVTSDGRFSIARLNPGAGAGDPTFWRGFITRLDGAATQSTTESFSNGTFQANTPVPGSYRYTSRFDPSTAPTGVVPIAAGDTLRVAIQISASDLPAGNGWCDFDANLGGPNNNCNSASRTREIVQTVVCNGCHSETPEVKLALHGGGRTQIEYCVTCHDPYTTDGQTGNTVDFPVMIHKIHYGSSLANGYTIIGNNNSVNDFSTVTFTKDVDNCTVCHQGGLDSGNWSMVPSMKTCGACHDNVNFATGANHGAGGVQTSNANCTGCHPSNGAHPPPGGIPQPIQAVHRGAARIAEGAHYAGGGNGFLINAATYNPSNRQVTIDYSVTRDGTKMTLESDPEWTAPDGASRLAVVLGWNTSDFTNAGHTSTPAQPISVNALNIGGVVQSLGGGVYRTVATLPSSATSGSVSIGLEGHPAADLDGDGTYSDRIAVRNDVMFLDATTGRPVGIVERRQVIDVTRCDTCHDAAGNGLSLHGNNRTGEDLCSICHNPNATDINRRPAPPAQTVDGQLEESIDFKRMIHRIHAGVELEDGLVIYGFGGAPNDFSHVDFIGNLRNCEACHLPGTYSTEDTHNGLPTTIDTGADKSVSTDDLNISPTASVCSACHDNEAALTHMKLHGASFHALDADIN